jgi:NAD-dependent DNA ligase
MPYVSRVECEHNRNNPNPKIEIISECPLCGTKLVTSDSNKSLICPNLECAGRSIQRMVNMFSKMNIKGFADATFRLLKDKDHLYKLYEYTDTGLPVINRKYYIDTLGVADGEAFSNILNDLISKPINDYMIMGSLGFNSIAHKKWQNILEFISIEEMNVLYNTTGNFAFDLSNIVPNIGEITAITIEKEWGFFKNDIEFILRYMNIISSKGSMKNCKGQIRFSGFRNQQLAEQLSTIGYDASDSSVTKKTDILLVPYDGFSSSKVTKAMKNPNTKIISLQEFIDNSTKYIGVELK